MSYRKSISCFFALMTVALTATAQLPNESNTITISLVPDPIGGNNLLLQVVASDVTDLYGIGFDMTFPKKRLRWKKGLNRAGEFLSEAESIETVVISKQRPRGSLHVAASRLADVGGVSGSGLIVEVGFVNRKKSGPRTLTLANEAAYNSNGQPIPEIVWVVEPFTQGPGS